MTICDQCDGSGFRMTDKDGNRMAVPCECRLILRMEAMLAWAGLPQRYQEASFDNWNRQEASRSIDQAHGRILAYCREYPTQSHMGLLMSGPVGVGKTHLAIATLRKLTQDYGVRGYFTDFRELLKRIQQTFNGSGSREQILRPVMTAELLVVDELGAARVTDWTFEIAEEIINARYNSARATIFTTNLPNADAPPHPDSGKGYGSMAHAMQVETLGERIGARMFSRLQEMCIPVNMTGEDYRRKKRA